MAENLLQQMLPDFYREALEALYQLERTDVVEQFPNLTLRRCTLDQSEGALYLYVGGVRGLNTVDENTIGVKHGECLVLNDVSGSVESLGLRFWIARMSNRN